MIELVSWNVNGIRAAEKKGFVDAVSELNADVVALQETKAHPEQLGDSLRDLPGYVSYWAAAERKGYSGVAVYARREAEQVRTLGIQEFDAEGRTLLLDFGDTTLINGYFPNSQAEGARLDYKLRYCDAILAECDRLVAEGRHVIVCGDFNIAHREIDLARPKQNEKNPGYLPEEREWMTKFLDAGYIDTFRSMTNEPGHYSWWSYRGGARERNVGWRIDYHVVDKASAERIRGASIRPDIHGSDHCPVTLTLSEDLP